ncbi:MAG TPA: phosphoribosylamine--glycine ligase [Clostridia bacterium]|nr:phosphoribosylamine--glycine ligase [Clostridia bacterium]
MKILMVGSGGREHALISSLKKSKKVDEIICAPGNGGIGRDAKIFSVAATDIEGMVALAKEQKVDLVFVAPDDPLAMGMVDRFQAEGIRAFGPDSSAAVIESSKVFSKNLMKKYNIPTAKYEVFDDANDALEYISEQGEYPTVIKADGLALGKGVIIAQNFDEAKEAIFSIMKDKVFGSSGNRVVIEEFLQGPEVSVLAFTDGKTVVPMVSSMDHKRAFDGDKGPNTGGMGAISPNPFYDEKLAELCMETIFLPTIKAMENEGRPFKGCLYFGLILTKYGPKVIEYNSRFGDPETQVVLPRLKTDLVDIINAVIDERLSEIDIEWSEDACACVIMASGGYPNKYKKGLPIKGLDKNGQLEKATVYHAGTKHENGCFYTNGGRVLGVTALGESIDDALKTVYSGIYKIEFNNSNYRKDIGKL